MSEEPEMRVVTVSTPWDETPEGMFRMDRLEARARAEREAFREKWGQKALDLVDEIEAKVERAMFFGDEDA